jgi:hypothetical protein
MNPDAVTPLVAKWAGILAVVGTLATAILSTTVLDDLATKHDWARVALLGLTALATIGGAVGGGRLAKRKVTPVANPQVEIAGRLVPLVPDIPPKETRRQRESRSRISDL